MDTYQSFAELEARERSGIDFRVRSRPGHMPVIIAAPHGGKIEPYTSEVAQAIAGPEYAFYAFEGLKPRNNRRLHITSTRFDEPQGDALVRAATYAVMIHGWANDDRLTYLGGRDDDLIRTIRAALENADFRVVTTGLPHLQGTELDNICNRCRRRKGVQLEISRKLRDDFRASSGDFHSYVEAVRRGISMMVDH